MLVVVVVVAAADDVELLFGICCLIRLSNSAKLRTLPVVVRLLSLANNLANAKHLLVYNTLLPFGAKEDGAPIGEDAVGAVAGDDTTAGCDAIRSGDDDRTASDSFSAAGGRSSKPVR